MWILDIIFKALEYIRGNIKDLPDFDFSLLRSPMSDSNPLIFLVEISNNSKNDYAIKEAIIFKRNEKTEKLFINYRAIIKKTDIQSLKTVRTMEDDYKNSQYIISKLRESKNINQIVIPSKSNKYFFVFYELDKSSYEYWKNFRRKTRIKGFIDEEGVIFPEWRGSDEWELVLKDDRNFFWLSSGKKIDLPVLTEELRLRSQIIQCFEEGKDDIWNIIKFRISFYVFKIKYKIKKILVIFGKSKI